MNLSILPDSIAIVRLSPEQEIPQWVWQDRSFLSLTRTTEELSIVCASSSVPTAVQCEKDWVAIKVQGPLDFSLTGILAGLAGPLAAHGIPIFAISTFDTDYLLVKKRDLSRAKEALEQAEHTFV
jgi:uncharacterized protein